MFLIQLLDAVIMGGAKRYGGANAVRPCANAMVKNPEITPMPSKRATQPTNNGQDAKVGAEQGPKNDLETQKLAEEIRLLKSPRIWPLLIPAIPSTILALATVYLAFSSGLLDMQRLVLKNDTTLLQIEKAKASEELATVKEQLRTSTAALRSFSDEDSAVRSIRKRLPFTTIKLLYPEQGNDDVSFGIELHATNFALFGGMLEAGQFHPETTHVLTEAAKFRKLNTLSIEKLLLTPDDMKAIWNLRKLGSLQLIENRVTDDMLQGFPSFEHLTSLAIRGQPLKKLRLPPLHKLTGLYIGGNQINDEELGYALAATPNLQFLDLKQLPITDASVAHIMKLPHVQYLNLEGTQLTPKGIKTLSLQSSVTTVLVYSGAVTPEDIKEIQKAKPSIQFNTTKLGS